MIRYLSICSGIEAATVAWHPLGWKPAAFSEIEAFPRALLSHRYPEVPLHGDFTTIKGDEYGAIDLIVGGTPCQSFSVAGLRGGLDDARGNLTLEFIRLAKRIKPRWLVWENVPGVLSIGGGEAFGAFLGGLAECGYGFAYRILDAQYFGVPQRRRRVFVVGYLGDWRRAAAVLFERESLRGDITPRREAREDVAGTLKACANSGGWGNSADHAAAGYMIPATHSLRAEGFDASEDGTGRGTPLVPATAYTVGNLKRGAGPAPSEESFPTLTASKGSGTSDQQPSVMTSAMQVRRLTPRECERLQGFPDDYTLIPYRGKPASDGPRYKALGNSMAVPVMAWLGQRIEGAERRAA